MLPLGHRKDVGGTRDQAGLAGGNAMRGDVPPSVGWSPSQVQEEATRPPGGSLQGLPLLHLVCHAPSSAEDRGSASAAALGKSQGGDFPL